MLEITCTPPHASRILRDPPHEVWTVDRTEHDDVISLPSHTDACGTPVDIAAPAFGDRLLADTTAAVYECSSGAVFCWLVIVGV